MHLLPKERKMRKRKYLITGAAAACFLLLAGCDAADFTQIQEPSSAVESQAPVQMPKEENPAEPLAVESISLEKYAYQMLDDEEKKVYDELVYAFLNREEDVTVATLSPEKMEHAYNAVRADYCNLFWVDRLSYVIYSLGDETTSIEITPEFTMTAEEQEQIQTQIDAEAERMLSGAPLDGSDFDKALYVYETLIREVDYVENSENNQNIISVFVNHQTICQGYAYATQYLLERLGIPCTTVVGTVADGETHAWNLVVLDGEYYYIDTTWGNSQFVYRNQDETESDGTGDESRKYLDYDYFGATTASLTATHTPDPEFPMPECSATADNYYVHEGLYIDTWDADRIGTIISDGLEEGEDDVQIKFADQALYEEALSYFIEDSHLFDYCNGMESVQYLENTDSNILTILF